MTPVTLLFLAATALGIGIVTAVLLRVGGLLLMTAGFAGLCLLRWLGDAAHPTLAETLLLLVTLQLGYLVAALTPLADHIRKGPAPRLKPEPRPAPRPASRKDAD